MADTRLLYVGGLDEQVDIKILQSAFEPFGELKAVDIPSTDSKGKHKGLDIKVIFLIVF